MSLWNTIKISLFDKCLLIQVSIDYAERPHGSHIESYENVYMYMYSKDLFHNIQVYEIGRLNSRFFLYTKG